MYIPFDFLPLAQLGKRCYAAALRPVEETYGLTRNEIDVLLFLSNNPAYDTARDIVELRALSKSHVCKSVDSLTRRGFLSSLQDQKDRRCIHLLLQPAAAPVIQDAQQAQKKFFQLLYCGITPEEIQAITHVLKRMDQNLKEASKC